MRSKIEMSWNSIYTPADVPLQVLVNDGSGSDLSLALSMQPHARGMG
jgi:C-terminal processing protease CtpA/Prc